MLPLSLACIHQVIYFIQLQHYCGTIVPLLDPVLLEVLAEFKVDWILDHQCSGCQKWLEFLYFICKL